MIIDHLLMPEKTVEKAMANWGENTLTILLLIVGGFAIWVATRKDHLILKSIVLAWMVLP